MAQGTKECAPASKNGGLCRGFLPSGGGSKRRPVPEKQSRTHVSSSSALLDIEKERQQNRLVVVSRDTGAVEKEGVSSTSIIDLKLTDNGQRQEDPGELGLVEIDTIQRRYMGSRSVYECSDDVERSLESQMLTTLSKPEAATRQEHENESIGPSPAWLMEEVESEQVDSEQDDGEKRIRIGAELKQSLSKSLYRLKRKNEKDWPRIATQFASTCLKGPEDWNFVWNSIVDMIANNTVSAESSSSSSNLAPLRLGACIMDQNGGLEPLVACLQQHHSSSSATPVKGNNILTRRRILGCISVVQFRLSEARIAYPPDLLRNLISKILAELVLIATIPNKRTVLAHCAFDLALEIVTIASQNLLDGGSMTCNTYSDLRHCHDYRQKRLVVMTLMQHLDAVDQLLDLQLAWMRVFLVKDNNGMHSFDKALYRCKISVVYEWKAINAYFRQDGKNAETGDDDCIERGLNWCKQVAGCVCSNSKQARIGSLCETLATRCYLHADDIIGCLETAVSILQSSPPEASTDIPLSKKLSLDQAGAITRGVVAWFAQKGKRLITTLGHAVDKVEKCMLILLRHRKNSITSVVLSGLHQLWSDSGFLPRDIVHTQDPESSTAVPSSFTTLVEVLSESFADEADLSQRDIVIDVLVRCIDCKGKALLEALIATDGTGHCATEVMARLLLHGERKGTQGVDELHSLASETILSHFQSSPVAVKKLAENPDIFRFVPTLSVVRELVRLAIQSMEENRTGHLHILLDVLLETLLPALDQEHPEAVRHLVHSLRDLVSTDSDKGTLDDLCAEIGSRFRSSLLGSKTTFLSFGRLLAGVGHEMIAFPSCMTTLTLFGRIAGDQVDLESSASSHGVRSIYTASTLVLHLCLDALASSSESDDIFQRLAPLLLLRRLSPAFFRTPDHILRQFDWYDGVEKHGALLALLGKHLARRLGIDACACPVEYSAEERRLSAEIAGRSLPLGSRVPVGPHTTTNTTEKASCYELICEPAFEGFIDALSSTATEEKSLPRRLNSAKAALFAFCCSLPYSTEEGEGGEELLHVAAFSLHLLQTEVDNLSERIDPGLVHQIQTGCIEFFALCCETFLRISSRGNDAWRQLDAGTSSSRETNAPVTFVQATKQIFDSVFQAARTGVFRQSCKLSVSAQPHKSTISIQGRICLWNSLVLVAQRCCTGHLVILRDMILSKTMEWGCMQNDGNETTERRHPVCVAAAMQVAVVLMSRTKTENCDWNLSVKEKRDVLRRAHGWAIQTLQEALSIARNDYHALQQSSALKLLMATHILSDGETKENPDYYLSSKELLERFLLLQELAGPGPDIDVRNIAKRLLQTFCG